MDTVRAGIYPVTVRLRLLDGNVPGENALVALGDQLAAAGVAAGSIEAVPDGLIAVVVETAGASWSIALMDAVRRVEAVTGGWLAVETAGVADEHGSVAADSV